MIGGLQGEFGDLDIKYLKQKISKCRSHISGSFKRTPRHCAKWLWNFRSKRTTFSQPKADFAAVQHSAFNLKWLASNGCNSLISTLNRAPFEALDCYLSELRKKTLRVSAIRGSENVWPGKLKRPPLPSGVRRRMWNIWRRWNVGRTEFRMWDIRRRWNVGGTKFLPGWNELCRASQGGPSACAREREPRGIF